MVWFSCSQMCLFHHKLISFCKSPYRGGERHKNKGSDFMNPAIFFLSCLSNLDRNPVVRNWFVYLCFLDPDCWPVNCDQRATLLLTSPATLSRGSTTWHQWQTERMVHVENVEELRSAQSNTLSAKYSFLLLVSVCVFIYRKTGLNSQEAVAWAQKTCGCGTFTAQSCFWFSKTKTIPQAGGQKAVQFPNTPRVTQSCSFLSHKTTQNKPFTIFAGI